VIHQAGNCIVVPCRRKGSIALCFQENLFEVASTNLSLVFFKMWPPF
jgi:hypothetical protein